MISTNKFKNLKLKKYFLEIRKEYGLFIVFSFLSCLMPIIYCLLSSLIMPDGSQAVMGIGHIIPFLLAFIQISFSISMMITSKIKEKYNDNEIIAKSIWLSFLIGILFSIGYIISSFCYMYFSNNKPNTQAMLWYSLDFLWITTPAIMLFPILSTFVFIIKRKNTITTLVLICLFFCLNTFLSYLLGIILNLKTTGLGLGILISLIILLFIGILIINKYYNISIFHSIACAYKIDFSIIRMIWNESITSISLSIFKGVAIICLSFTIPDTISGFVPLSYQMSRVIWFNMMYFIPFIGIGISEEIRYHYLTYHNQNNENNCYSNHSFKKDYQAILITLIFTIVISISCILLVQPINYLYIINDKNIFQDGKMPEIEGWGIPTLAPSYIINFNDLKNLQISPLPDFLPNNTTENKLQNSLLFANWVSEQIKNNPNFKDGLSTLTKWYEWFEQINNQGISLWDFIETKYGFKFLDEIKNITTGNAPSTGFANGVKGIMSYFTYLWLYSSTNEVVTSSFLLLRPWINFNNVLTSEKGDEIINALSKNTLDNVLTSLYLSINTFNAKAIIYVSIYGISNSIWSILIQINQRNEKKGMPYWLLILIYGICIGSLVTFGVIFGVILNDKLGNNNPFKYLDAWTFPLVIISTIVIIVLIIKSIISYKKLKYMN